MFQELWNHLDRCLWQHQICSITHKKMINIFTGLKLAPYVSPKHGYHKNLLNRWLWLDQTLYSRKVLLDEYRNDNPLSIQRKSFQKWTFKYIAPLVLIFYIEFMCISFLHMIVIVWMIHLWFISFYVYIYVY